MSIGDVVVLTTNKNLADKSAESRKSCHSNYFLEIDRLQILAYDDGYIFNFFNVLLKRIQGRPLLKWKVINVWWYKGFARHVPFGVR
jgi:hypothetical protein